MRNNRIVFMGNGSPENEGCEAITKGTIEILNKTFTNYLYIDAYFNYKNKIQSSDENNYVQPVDYPKRWSLKWLILQVCLYLSNRLTGSLLFHNHKDIIDKASAVLSLGGDNYSLDYGIPRRFIAMGKYVKRFNTKFVIWGASIGPFEKGSKFEKKIIQHFNQDVDLILVREEISKQYLDSIGVRNKVFVVPDPAFMMNPEDCSHKQELPSKYICINFSDLMAKYVTNGNLDLWIDMCAQIIDTLYESISEEMVFIPHVESDYDLCKKIMIRCKHKDIVTLIDKHLNAAEMKWIISQSLCNIACRTHSTIASFSTGVPTLSLGYSIKSKGLNLQMYGHEEFLLYKEEIGLESVINSTKVIFKNLENIKCHLKERSEQIKKEACKAGIMLSELIQ